MTDGDDRSPVVHECCTSMAPGPDGRPIWVSTCSCGWRSRSHHDEYGAAKVEERKSTREARWAGSDETDADGRRRDTRAFLSTRLALRRPSSGQMGWQNNHSAYRDDLLTLVGAQFVKDGLSVEHGITMHVSQDGQGWSA